MITATPAHEAALHRGFESLAGLHRGGLRLDQQVCSGVLVIECRFQLDDLAGGS